MKAHSVSMIMVSAFLLVAFGFAQAYATGKILSITKRTAKTAPGHTDAPMKTSVDDYDVTISSSGTVYAAVYHRQGGLDPAWAEGKEVPVQVAGKVLHVKNASGKVETLKIVSSKPATP
jgi:multidrug efflux pump subunit AcrA (membrane-fusion protein)